MNIINVMNIIKMGGACLVIIISQIAIGMVNCRSLCVSFVGLLVGILFEYDTPKFVHIKSKKVGVLNRLVQLGIVGYIIGYVDCISYFDCLFSTFFIVYTFFRPFM